MSLSDSNGVPLTMPVQPAGTNNNGGGWGFGGDALIALIILFLFPFMFGGMGFGGMGMMGGMGMWPWMFGNFGGNSPGFQGALTRGELCQDMNFQDVKNGVRNANDSTNLGFANLNSTICHQQYDTAMLVNGIGNTVQQGFSQAELSRCNQQALLMQQLFQMQAAAQQCCCDTRQDINNVRFTIAQEDCNTRNTIQTNTRDIIDNANANTRAILDKMCQQELAAKDAQIAAQNQKIFALQLAKSQGQQTAEIEARADARLNQVLHAINPPSVPAYPAPAPCGLGNWSPNVLANGYGYNNGCGCNC